MSEREKRERGTESDVEVEEVVYIYIIERSLEKGSPLIGTVGIWGFWITQQHRLFKVNPQIGLVPKL